MRKPGKTGIALTVLVPIALAAGTARSWYGNETQADAQSAFGQFSAQSRAQWERRWITPLDTNLCTTNPEQTSRFMAPNGENSFRTTGGIVDLQISPQHGHAYGKWTLHEVQAAWGWLHAHLPPGFRLRTASAGNASVVPEIHDGHMALALDTCTGKACTVTIEFDVTLDAAPGRIGAGGIWLRAADILPRLGLDGDRLLRSPEARREQGMVDYPTLPDHHAAVPVAAVAPAGHWRWQVSLGDGQPETPPYEEYGQTDAPLDFSIAWAPSWHRRTTDRVQVSYPDQLAAAPAIVHEDLRSMQACLEQKLGDAGRVDRIVLTPQGVGPGATGLSGIPAAQLAAGQLWLPQALLQDRTALRASMAQAMALRHIADTARLRQGKSAQWLAEGLPGALALLCVAQTDAPLKVQELLRRATQSANAAMQAQPDELGAVAYAAFSGWVRHYAPLASLDVARRLSREQLQNMLAALRSDVRVQYAMADTLGANLTLLALSMPLASTLPQRPDGHLEGRRWRWQQGQWKAYGRTHHPWTLPTPPNETHDREQQAILLDNWPSIGLQFLNDADSGVSPIDTKEPI